MGDQAEIRQILVANDHAGVEFKAQLRSSSSLKDVTFVDLGVFETTSVDYPDVAVTLAEKMKNVPNALGLLICGSGIGVSMAANRFSHMRAALCHDVTTARLARQHNDANVLVMGARTTGIQTAIDMILAFMSASFEGGRHQGRVDKLNHLTNK
ncbi:MAG: ribose 5-phosphate isomerase B [Alphaproteobacteria bacterium]|jgi:ribose 5-phosphate isomerase B|nr:ribose 5-phosphate isomerase B [Alphaproteobacteria bacterium]